MNTLDSLIALDLPPQRMVKACHFGETIEVPCIAYRGVWAVTHALDLGGGIQPDRFLITHVPTGAAIANADTKWSGSIGFKSEAAISLCRVLGERWGDFGADAAFGAADDMELPVELTVAVNAALRGVPL